MIVPSRWKAVGAALLLLLGAAGALHRGDPAVAPGPDADLVEVGGGVAGPFGGDGVPPLEAAPQGPQTSRGSINDSDEQQYKLEAGGDASSKSNLAEMLDFFIVTGPQERDENGEEDALIGDGRTFSQTPNGGRQKINTLHESVNIVQDVDNDDTANQHPPTTKKHIKYLVSSKESPGDRLAAAHDIAKSALAKILDTKKSYEDGDAKALGSVVKSVLGDVEPLVEVGKSMGIASPSIDMDVSDKGLVAGMSLELMEFLRNHATTFDVLEEHAKHLISLLESLDLTLYSPSEKSNTDELVKDDFFEFDMSQADSDDTDSKDDRFDSFRFDSSAPSWRGQHRSPRETFGQSHPKSFAHNRALHDALSSHPTSRHLGTLSLLNNKEVDARHNLRLNALGDSCPDNCAMTDKTCNCQKLYKCVEKMSAYDLAYLLSSGYIENDQNSDKYGQFTVDSAVDLKLFNAENGQGLDQKMEDIKAKVSGGQQNCNAVLQEFHFPCENPNKLCWEPNTQSFQATIEQVCDAVNTPTKLLFEAIGAEFDSFSEVTPNTSCFPSSYATCGEFLRLFDRLYEARDKSIYPLANPMRKVPNTTLSDMSDAGHDGVFAHVEFPKKYVMSTDTFGVSLGFETIVSIASAGSGEVMGVDQCSAGSNVAVLTNSGSDRFSHFFLVGRKIISAKCPLFALYVSGCNNNAHITLRAKEDISPRMEWKFENEELKSVGCPGYAAVTVSNSNNIAISKGDNPIKWTKQQLAPPRIISHISTNKAISVEPWSSTALCHDGAELSLKDRNPGDMSQQFYVHSVNAISGRSGVQVDIQPTNYLGGYFKYNEAEWEAYFGSVPKVDANGKLFQVKQCRGGIEKWNGEVFAVINSDGQHVGRKNPTRAAGDWEDGDYIVKQNEPCPNHSIESALCPNLGIAIKDGCPSDLATASELVLQTIPSPAQSNFYWTVNRHNGNIESSCSHDLAESRSLVIGSNPETSQPKLEQSFDMSDLTWSWPNLDDVFTITNMERKKALAVSSEGCDYHESNFLSQPFAIALVATGKVLTVDGYTCARGTALSLSLQDYVPGNAAQRFIFRTDHTIELAECTVLGLHLSSACAADAKLKTWNLWSTNPDEMKWTLTEDGYMESHEVCPDGSRKVIGSNTDGPLQGSGQNSANKYRVIRDGGAYLGLEDVTGKINQQFRFRDGQIIPEMCPTKRVHVPVEGAIGYGCNMTHPILWLIDDHLDCSTCEWIFHDDGIIESADCKQHVITAELWEGDMRLQRLDYGRGLDGELIRQGWRLDKANYETSFAPHFSGHPRDQDSNGCVASSPNTLIDKGQALKLMRSCDLAMKTLTGPSMSLGSLKAIVDTVEEKGAGKMPGVCCLDNALDSQHFGYNYNPINMICKNPGPWHLGLAQEICAAAGGQWTRTPCSTLKACIDSRPKRFDLHKSTSTFDEIKGSVNFGYVAAKMNHAGFLEDFGPSVPVQRGTLPMDGEIQIKQSLPDAPKFFETDQPPPELLSQPFAITLIDTGKVLTVDGYRCKQSTKLSISLQDYVPGNAAQRFKNRTDHTIELAECTLLGLNLYSACAADAILETWNLWSTNPDAMKWTLTEDGYMESHKLCSDGTRQVIGSNTDGQLQGSEERNSQNKYRFTRFGGAACAGDSGCASNNCVPLNWRDTSGNVREARVCSIHAVVTLLPIGSQCTQGSDCGPGAWCNGGSITSIGTCQNAPPPPALLSLPFPITLKATGKVLTVDGYRCAESTALSISLQDYVPGNAAQQFIFNSDHTIALAECTKLGIRLQSACASDAKLQTWNLWSTNSDDMKWTLTEEGYMESHKLCPDGTRQVIGSNTDGQLQGSERNSQNKYSILIGILKPCFNFCYSLPDYKVQVGMMVEEVADGHNCVCIYRDGMAPKRDLIPAYATRNPPTFYITDPNSGSALGVPPGSKCTDAIGLEAQKHVDGSLRQEFQFSYDGRIINLACPQFALTAASRRYPNGVQVDIYTTTTPLGSYFKYNETQWEAYFGSVPNDATGQLFQVKRCRPGVEEWTGKVKALINGDGHHVGRKEPYAARAAGDWKAGDYIVKQNETCIAVSSSGELKATTPYSEGSNSQQQWNFDNGLIKNVLHPDLTIAAAKGDSSFKSEYFAIRNPSSGLAIGVDGDCANNPKLVLQTFKDGSPRQNFKLVGARIVSVMCPSSAIGFPASDCALGTQVTLVNNQLGAAEWIFNDNGIIQSTGCSNNAVIGIDGTGSHSGRVKFANLMTTRNSSAMSKDTEIYSPGNYTNANAPVTGTFVVLSSLISNTATAQKYQQWTQKFQRFQDLLGPFRFTTEFIGSSTTHAIGAIQGDCVHEMQLQTQAYDTHETSQDFFIGKHGSIFSAKCRGLAIGVASDCSSTQIGLQVYQPKQKGMKWKYTEDGILESVLCPNNVLSTENTNIVLSPSTTSNSIQHWRRENTRLLSEPLTDDTWIGNWTVKFVQDNYTDTLSGSVATLERHSYPSNPAFSPSFDDFTREFVVKDAKDEEQCRKAREGMGYDMDYPYDADLCQRFRKWLCQGKEFTGIDLLVGEGSAKRPPPKMSVKPVEYEKVEYDEVSYEAPAYDDDDDFQLEPLGTEADWIIAESHENEDQAELGEIQDDWLKLNSARIGLELAMEFKDEFSEKVCNVMPAFIPVPFVGNIPNPLVIICWIASIVLQAVGFAVQIAISVAENVVFNAYEKATEGPDVEIYANDASRKTYNNLKNLDTFTKKSLKAIDKNMVDQHTLMRQHLQDRHLALETNLGQGLVDAQNALGQGIVDAQNANGKLVVDAQNSITDKLCMIYKQVDGDCSPAIGPLQEGQLIIPFDFYLPEGHLSLSETLHNTLTDIQEALVLSSMPNNARNIGSQPGDSTADFMVIKEMIGRVVQEKVEAMEEHLNKNHAMVEKKVAAMEEKVVSEIEAKVGGKVAAMEEKVEKMMDMMANLMDMMN